MKKVDEFFGRQRSDDERKREIMDSVVPPPAMTNVPGPAADNLERFTKKFIKKATDIWVNKSGDDFVFSAEVPGKSTGWFAVYQKLVNAAGETVGMIKSTMDPQGIVRHIKNKF